MHFTRVQFRKIRTLLIATTTTLIVTGAPPAIASPIVSSTNTVAAGANTEVLQPRSGSSTLGVDWHVEQPNNGFIVSDVTYGNGYFVAVSSQTNSTAYKVARSPDGRVWTVGPDALDPTASLPTSWTSVTFGNGQFLAVASNGKMMSSTDGLNWTNRTPSDGGEVWIDVAYGNGTFVAIAPNGYARYSLDGITWVRSSLQAIFGNVNALAFGNGIFAAVGNTYSFTSSDGITWSDSNDIGSLTGGYNYGGLAYGGDKWVALRTDTGGGSTTSASLYSSDGLNWDQVNPTTNIPGKCFNALTYGGGLFVALSCKQGGYPAGIISSNGTSWTNVLTDWPGHDNPRPAIAFGDGMFVGMSYNRVYTSQATPAISGVSPASGPTPGGRTITITGTALQNTTAVTFNGVAATSFANVSSTQITAVAPTGTAGTATIEITTWGGSTTSTGFTYVTPPVITSLSPTSAPTTGGRTIVVSGTDLGNTTSVTVGGVAATGITNTSGTQISFVTPAGPEGSQNVVLTTEGGGSFTYPAGITNVVPPVVATVSPALGFDSGGTSVTVTGTNLSNTTSVTVGGAAATNVTNVSDTQITFTSPSGTIGTRDLVVTTAGGGPVTSSDAFRYIGQPTITNVSPVGGPTTGGTSVVITGTNLTGTNSVSIGGVAATITGNTDTSVTVTAPPNSAGVDNIVLQTWSGAATVTSSSAYTYVTPPTITSFTPTTHLTSGSGTVTLTGNNLTNTTQVTIGGVAATNLTVDSPTQVSFTVPAGTAGLSTVSLSTALGGTTSNSGTFRYIEAPTITSLTPTVGPIAGGTTVTVTGTNLANTTSVTVGGVEVTALTNISNTSISFTTALSGVAGLRNIVLETYSGVGTVTSSGAFRYVPAPTITAITPSAGPVAGGNTVTITGTNLTNTTSVSFGGTPATSFSNVSDTQITAVVPVFGSSTPVSVTVQTYDGNGSVTLSNTYAYVPLPLISSLSTTTGLATGGTTVTVTGANLANTSGVTVGGVSATGVVNVSGTSVRFTTPPGVAGLQDVVLTTTYGGSVTSANAFRYIEAPSITSITPPGGPTAGGTQIVIAGANLDNATSVTIGGTAANVTANTGTSVTVTTPAGSAGAKSITLQTYDGVGSVTSSNAFTYVAPPTIASLSSTVATTGGGQTILLSGTNLDNTSSVTLGSTSVASLSNVSATRVQFVVPAGSAGLKDVTLTTTYGGSVTSVNAFRYIGAPAITSITPNIGSTAGGDTVTIAGANLTNVTRVLIGTSIGTVTANTADSLTFTTGSATSAGTKDVTVQTYNGAGSVSSSNAYTYVSPPTIASVTPDRGVVVGGTSVTISGANLLNATNVTFGGIAGTVTANTGTSLTVTTPASSSGSKNVAITTTGGGTATSLGAFTFVAQPTITAITPDAGPTTGGVAVTLTGTNLGNATSVSIGGVSATITSNSATAIVVTTPAGTSGSTDVVVETYGGVGTITASSAYTFVTPPTLASLSPTAGVAGTVITLTGTGLTPTTAVTVGSQPATFTVVNDTEVEIIAPGSLTGTRVVVLTTPGGAVVASQLFAFPDPPAPAPDSGNSTSESSASTSNAMTLQGNLGPEPPASPLLPGQEMVVVGGQRIPAIVSANQANTGLSLRGAGWGLSLETRSPAGTPTALGANGALVLTSGGTLPIGGSGYAPGTDATVYLMSTPQLLGVFPITSQGNLLGTLKLPAGIAPGNHTIQVNGLGADGLVRRISLGVLAAEPNKRMQQIGTRVLFELGSSELTRPARKSLRNLVNQVPSDITAFSLVSGALRNSGATKSDRRLARLRASTVASFLREQGLRGSIKVTTRKTSVSQRPQDRNVSVSITWGSIE